MVIVVPAFTEVRDGEPETVAAVIACWVRLRTEAVGDRPNAPERVVHNEKPYHAAPDKAPEGAHPAPYPEGANHSWDHQPHHYPQRIGPIQPHRDRVASQVIGKTYRVCNLRPPDIGD